MQHVYEVQCCMEVKPGAANTEQVARLSRAEMRMVRCVWSVTKREED